MAATRGTGRSVRKGVPSSDGPGAAAAGASGLQSMKGRARVVVEDIRPRVDAGAFPAKREVGDVVEVSADVFADGHDEVAAELRWRAGDGSWSSTPMSPLGNDRFRAVFEVPAQGRYRFCIRAFVDPYATWVRDTMVKLAAGRDVTVELLVGAELLRAAASRAKGKDRTALERAAEDLRAAADSGDLSDALAAAGTLDRQVMLRRFPDPDTVVTSEPLEVMVERRRARFSSWYELFPRSASDDPERHGTLADVERRLEYV
ncbi:MAG TPA: maltotransferase domain-containing protein, partial [Acidimicrobiales bacterium]|nr:maltotransferase domain-containing protein [Acidimicrobiales bacterium]